jgi:hypothetical protein
MQVENNLYYQFLMDNGNNFHVAVFYKWNLATDEITNLGVLDVAPNARITSNNYSGIKFNLFKNKLFVTYDDVWFIDAAIVSIDLATNNIQLLKHSKNMFSMILVDNNIYYLLSIMEVQLV